MQYKPRTRTLDIDEEPEILDRLVAMASMDMTIQQMCTVQGWSESTFRRARAQWPEIDDAIAQGRTLSEIELLSANRDLVRSRDGAHVRYNMNNRFGWSNDPARNRVEEQAQALRSIDTSDNNGELKARVKELLDKLSPKALPE